MKVLEALSLVSPTRMVFFSVSILAARAALIVEPGGFATLVFVDGMIAHQVDLSGNKRALGLVMVPDGEVIDNRFLEGGEIDAFTGLGGVVNGLELHPVEEELEQRHLLLGAVFDQLLDLIVGQRVVPHTRSVRFR